MCNVSCAVYQDAQSSIWITGSGSSDSYLAIMKTLAYNTSKGAVITFTQALACEWGTHGITVNAICPGVFPTKMAAGLIDILGPGYLELVPLRRVGDSEDLKGLAVLLASDAGKHITGQWMAVDGGVSALAGG